MIGKLGKEDCSPHSCSQNDSAVPLFEVQYVFM
jgi:hypothetical protein